MTVFFLSYFLVYKFHLYVLKVFIDNIALSQNYLYHYLYFNQTKNLYDYNFWI